MEPNFSDVNLLLAEMMPEDRLSLQPHLESVTLTTGQDLVLAGEPVRWVYFMGTSLSSMVSESPGRKTIEVGMVGREGVVGTEVLLGADKAVYRTFIQTGGDALRIDAAILVELAEARPAMRQVLLRSAHRLMTQIAESLVACCRYTLEQRLARWILMAHDRVKSADIPLTHEFLASMLGVRRPGVTVALHILEGERAIRSNRGQVVIRDRAKLEDMAGEAYSEVIAAQLAADPARVLHSV